MDIRKKNENIYTNKKWSKKVYTKINNKNKSILEIVLYIIFLNIFDIITQLNYTKLWYNIPYI